MSRFSLSCIALLWARRARQARLHSAAMGGQAGQATPEGSRRTLDRQIHQGQARREWPGPRVDLAIPAFGYKSHIGIDRRHRLIRRWTVTDAARHDEGRCCPC